MRVILQRVTDASVSVDSEIIGKIGTGLLVLLGVGPEDGPEDIDYLVNKICNMRIFEDENGKMNLSVKDIGGSLLVISQFTLFANCKKGNRPSFTEAGSPDFSNKLYEEFIAQCRSTNVPTEHGKFGSDMDVSLTNQGPVTIFLDSKTI